jgi:GTP-binding protein HflX
VLDIDRQKVRNRIAELQEQIDQMELGRDVQRSRRQDGQGFARVALVGYTNAGKSTLMRALTGNEVLVADKLFATLDTTVRALQPETVPRVLMTDTVGFIKNLPHALVASFKSTLDEALEASLIAHVVDASDPDWEGQLKVTEGVLNEIGARDVPRLMVFNKIDRTEDEVETTSTLRLVYPGCVVMSARRPEDVALLREKIAGYFRKDLAEAELFVPWSEQKLRGEIFDKCEVLEEKSEEEGTRFRLRAEPQTLQRLGVKPG